MALYSLRRSADLFRLDASSGLRDAKGREVGFAGWAYRWEATELPADATSGHRIDTSRLYRAEVQKTKAGRPFGASQPALSFATLEEAEAHVRETVAARIAKTQRGAAR